MVGRRKLPDLLLNQIFNTLSIDIQYTLSIQWTNFDLKYLITMSQNNLATVIQITHTQESFHIYLFLESNYQLVPRLKKVRESSNNSSLFIVRNFNTEAQCTAVFSSSGPYFIHQTIIAKTSFSRFMSLTRSAWRCACWKWWWSSVSSALQELVPSLAQLLLSPTFWWQWEAFKVS